MSNTTQPNPTLFELFGNSGPSALLIAVVGFRWAISIVGIAFNSLLFWITLKNRSLRGTCNFLIAFDALATAVYQSSNSVSMFIVLSGINFIPLRPCFYLMIHAIVGCTLSLSTAFFIAVDRLLSVLFPIKFGQQKSKWFLAVSVASTSGYMFYMLANCYASSMAIPETRVICSLTDCYPNEAGQLSFRNSIILVLITCSLYLLIWICLKWRKTSKTNKNGVNYTQQIFKSLAVITAMMFIGWMLNAAARYTLPLMKLSNLQSFFVSFALGSITNFVMAANAPVLYAFSKDYKKAFQHLFRNGIKSTAVSSIHRSQAMTRSIHQITVNPTRN